MHLLEANVILYNIQKNPQIKNIERADNSSNLRRFTVFEKYKEL